MMQEYGVDGRLFFAVITGRTFAQTVSVWAASSQKHSPWVFDSDKQGRNQQIFSGTKIIVACCCT